MGVSNFDTVAADAVVTDELTADEITADEINIGEAGLYPVIMATSAPTTATAGAVGQLYCDKTNKKLWICVAASTTYTWYGVAIA